MYCMLLPIPKAFLDTGPAGETTGFFSNGGGLSFASFWLRTGSSPGGLPWVLLRFNGRLLHLRS